MVELSRYNTGDDDLNEQRVLKNKPGITDEQILCDAETIILKDNYDHRY